MLFKKTDTILKATREENEYFSSKILLLHNEEYNCDVLVWQVL